MVNEYDNERILGKDTWSNKNLRTLAVLYIIAGQFKHELNKTKEGTEQFYTFIEFYLLKKMKALVVFV